MATNEEILDKLDVIQNRCTGIETVIEEMKNNKPETVEMNDVDRSILLSAMNTLEGDLSKNIKEAIIKQQTDFKVYQDDYSKKISGRLDANQKGAVYLIDKMNAASVSIEALGKKMTDSIENGFRNMNLRSEIEEIMNTTIKESLERQTSNNEQSVIKLGNTAVQMRDYFQKTLPKRYTSAALVIAIISGLIGFSLHVVYQQTVCENVFEQFYKEKYDAEIKAPKEKAVKEASEYLEQKKKEADEYKEQKNKDADEYLDSKKKEADAKAEEEFKSRLAAYGEIAKKEAEKIQKTKTDPGEAVK